MSQSLTDFSDLIRSARESAVHLELRDEYRVENEVERFAAWQRGHRLDVDDRPSWWRPWLDLVQEVTAKGVAVRRARIVSEPVSEYIAFEHSGTFTNVAAGEEVRWLPRGRASDLLLPGNDYWQFDGRLVQFNIFDGSGNWVRTDQTDDPVITRQCATAFDAVWQRAVPHEKFTV
ncbi:DUF6879 family protein [Streptomyces sp. NPDC127068]|uniref:DUF6879 family protein n=1 Tax=Streptomyces sp. NPDC127068 TaxID=3347127 RepID=UPI0036682E52